MARKPKKQDDKPVVPSPAELARMVHRGSATGVYAEMQAGTYKPQRKTGKRSKAKNK